MQTRPNTTSSTPCDTAILTTRTGEGFSADRHWPAVRDMRRGHARTLGLKGVILLESDTILYGVEGGARDIDRFIQMVGASPCESSLRLVSRCSEPRRVYLRPTLIAPRLLARERSWLHETLAAELPDAAALSTFLTWLALQEAEAEIGDLGHLATRSRTDFPFASRTPNP